MERNEYLFGQYLVRFSKIKLDPRILEKALLLQEKEDIDLVHRRIGTILFEEFNIFSNLDELLSELELFNEFKKKYLD